MKKKRIIDGISKEILLATILILVVLLAIFIPPIVKKSYCGDGGGGKLFSGGSDCRSCVENDDGSVTNECGGVTICDRCNSNDMSVTEVHCEGDTLVQTGVDYPEGCTANRCIPGFGEGSDDYCITQVIEGDFTGDGCVNLEDYAIFASNLGNGCSGNLDEDPLCSEEDCQCGGSDLNGDGCVDMLDMPIMLENWGEGC